MKKNILKQAKQEFIGSFEKLKELLLSEDMKTVCVKDGIWEESSSSIVDLFDPKVAIFIKKVNILIDNIPSRRGRPRKEKKLA